MDILTIVLHHMWTLVLSLREEGLQHTHSFLVPVGTCYLTGNYCYLDVS